MNFMGGGNFMRKFSILHLSDLHITKSRNSYPMVLKKLISDIAKEMANIDSIIVIVTGDIIDKAKYDEASDAVVSFFEDLNTSLKSKITRIYFTPGNHDKKRVGCHEAMQNYFSGKKYDDLYNEFESGDWKNLFYYMFNDYVNLIRRISEKIGVKINTDLFYCDVFEINNCYVRVNCINSSLTSFNDSDYGLLHIGKFQIDKIERDFEKIKEDLSGKKIDVSITIMHHPTFWL